MTHCDVIWRTHGPKYHLSNDHSKCAIQMIIQITHFALVWKQSKLYFKLTVGDVFFLSNIAKHFVEMCRSEYRHKIQFIRTIYTREMFWVVNQKSLWKWVFIWILPTLISFPLSSELLAWCIVYIPLQNASKSPATFCLYDREFVLGHGTSSFFWGGGAGHGESAACLYADKLKYLMNNNAFSWPVHVITFDRKYVWSHFNISFFPCVKYSAV